MIYVINTNLAKKSIHRYLKDKDIDSKIFTFKELVQDRNSKIKRKKEKYTEELMSTEFDTPLGSTKNEIGLKDCIFIKTDIDILDLIRDNFELIEVV